MNGLKQNQQEQETMRPAVWAVIPAGGTGQRYSQNENKLLLNLLGQPVLWWSVKAFLETASIDGLVIAAHADYQEVYQHVLLDLIQAQNKPVFWAPGGETRRDSVYSALLRIQECLLADQKIETETHPLVVSIHDAARPLITPKDIEKSLMLFLRKTSTNLAGTVLGKGLMDTIKRLGVGHEISETVNREEHWAAQTPQNFPLSVLLKAHQTVSKEALITDDAQLVELAQLGRVFAIEADDENLKLTRPQDFALCEWVLRQRQNSR